MVTFTISLGNLAKFLFSILTIICYAVLEALLPEKADYLPEAKTHISFN